MRYLTALMFFALAIPAHAEFYVGMNAGAYLYDQEIDVPGADDVELRDAMLGAHAGVSFTDWIGLEAWYQNFFEGSETVGGSIKVRADGDVYGISLRPALRVSQDFELFAKLGMGFWDAKVKLEYPEEDQRLSGDDDGSDFSWGFGGRWWGGDHWSLATEFSRIEAGKDVQFDTVSFNAAYHF